MESMSESSQAMLCLFSGALYVYYKVMATYLLFSQTLQLKTSNDHWQLTDLNWKPDSQKVSGFDIGRLASASYFSSLVNLHNVYNIKLLSEDTDV